MLKQSMPMKPSEIKKKFRRWFFLTRLWLWAAVHSPKFQECQILLYSFPITASINRRRWGSTFLSITLEFNRLEWNMFIPSDVYSVFEKTYRIQDASEYITPDDVGGIPF
jgi:hypothetical protein